MKKMRSHLSATTAAVSALGALVATGRRERGWTSAELAERLGVSPRTVSNIEHGAPTVAVGVVFEAAVLVGVPLFNRPTGDLPRIADEALARLAVLPERVRPARSVNVDDNF